MAADVEIDVYEDYERVGSVAELFGPGNRILELEPEEPPAIPEYAFLNGAPDIEYGMGRWPIQLRVVKVDNVLFLPQRTIVNADTGRLLLDSLRKPLGPDHPLPDETERRIQPERLNDIMRDAATVRVGGTTFNAASRNGGYGHVLLEAVSQLWAAADLDLTTMPVAVNGLRPDLRYHLQLLRPFGVTERNAIRVNRGNMWFESLILASQSYVLPKRISERFWDVMQRVREFYAPGADEGPHDRRLFVSRRKASKRRLDNEECIEQIFAGHGFEIFHPEDHDVPEQIRTFATASWIAGSVGSGLYNTVFAPAGVRRIILAPGHFYTPNDVLMTREHGPLYLFGRSGSPNPKQAIIEDWTIDAEAVERAVAGVFATEDAS
ncbi:glycosyltransferase family 61 protein [Capillimicrobium parvum]|uniref:Glycosyltransferase 61 catalytic domain-containing protein n=1 Tax=Capillimicrobium parvum TaxID=2884022 RepID=A0A9E6Y2H3_9ACTN|nr:glycosyltransferase family 61 protein [Capillimicrobium parvum]UGS38815.1 hypothetical protein DSM104329_05245 [Capillimicrobium parvum]